MGSEADPPGGFCKSLEGIYLNEKIIAATAVALTVALPAATTGFAESNMDRYEYFATPNMQIGQRSYTGEITGVCKAGAPMSMTQSPYGPFAVSGTCSVVVNGVLDSYNPYGPVVI